MSSMFDLVATALFMAAAATFFARFQRENPPLAPYAAISLAAGAGNWLGENGMAALAVALLVSGAFLLLHLVSQPYFDERGR